jgi:hypothetical protein
MINGLFGVSMLATSRRQFPALRGSPARGIGLYVDCPLDEFCCNSSPRADFPESPFRDSNL